MMRLLASLLVLGAFATAVAVETQFVALQTGREGTAVVTIAWNDTVPNAAKFTVISAPAMHLAGTTPEVDGGAYTTETRTLYSVLKVAGRNNSLVAWVRGEPVWLYDFPPGQTMRGLYYDKTSQTVMGVCGEPLRGSVTVLANARPCQYVPSFHAWNFFGPPVYAFEVKQHSWTRNGQYLVRLTSANSTKSLLWGCQPRACSSTIQTYYDSFASTRTTCYDGSSLTNWVGMSLEKEFWDLSQQQASGSYRPTDAFTQEQRYEVNTDLCAYDDTNLIYMVDLPDAHGRSEVLVAKGIKKSSIEWKIAGRFRLPDGVRISNPQYGTR